MKTIYLMRHGTTYWNEQGIIQGNLANRLNKAGVQEAENQAQKLKDTPIDVLYVSPVFRAVQTANIVNKYHGAKVIKDQRIREIGQGIFKGRKKSTLTPEEIKLRSSYDSSVGNEKHIDLVRRCRDFIFDIAKNCPYENILVVTHNACCSAIELTLLDPNTIPDVEHNVLLDRFGNAEVKKFVVENGVLVNSAN